MAKPSFKFRAVHQSRVTPTSSVDSSGQSKPGFKSSFRASFYRQREKIWQHKRQRVRLHRSFRRSYHEDYQRPTAVPGLLQHAATTFGYLFRNWKLFGGLLLLVTILNVVLVGLMSEDTYVSFQETLDETSAELAQGELGNFAKAGLLLVSTVTTGGLSQGLTEVQQVFAIIIFLLIWLVTIYLLRHLLSDHRPKLRDGLYNALTPLLSTFCIVALVFIQLIPVMLVIITYSAAIATDFLATPFYALVYFIFAALMILLSCYLLSSSLIALAAVTAPGLYPLVALRTASDLMAGRRIKFIIRVFYLILVIAFVLVITMLPIITLDLILKNALDWLAGLPITPFFLLLMTCFSFMYLSAYIYLYYRRMLDYDHQ